ncbi:peptide/nickel transport system ATP-binding protein [Desulfocicer vacuolatum DSM 3385]|uniref:Peptide/nickel transport system ATP-binding protein n=1 Tax=Desulfocicer vacuolatum DSM 3385 TaxID=1121400 RepID=A0A1W2B911_9BACT|nr:peptide/nickel transport system ATP-binding protein [Desulfocicer vacuolatum DSM 3385]
MVNNRVCCSPETGAVFPLLQVDGLVTAFDTEKGCVNAVDGASFSMAPGTTLGIVGESGCGKSVTALSIMGLLPRPSGRIVSGHIVFDGKDLPTLSPKEMQAIRGRRMSMIFQEPMTALNPVQRIGSQINEIYAIHFPGMTKKQRTRGAVTMLSQVGIAEPSMVMNNYPHQLSGGMRQRVMIAMALASSPDILIADEPTTALDVTVQAQILELIKELQGKMGMSVMLITHDLGVIAENCDDAVVMYGGRVVERAGVKDLFKNPFHPYTKGLISSIPGLAEKPKSLLPTIKGRVPSLDKMPLGCRFSNRCPHVMDICHTTPPPETLVGVSRGHFASCYLPGESRD